MTITNNDHNILISTHHSPIEVQQLRYRHIFKAAKTLMEANVDDPLNLYLRNNRRRTPVEQVVGRIRTAAVVAFWIRTKVALTVQGGTSTLIATPPHRRPGGRENPLTRLAKRIAKAQNRVTRRVTHKDPEETRRMEEFNRLMDEAVSRTIGDSVKKMWYIDGLATDPNSQGQGFGGALLDSIATFADILSETTWLQSSNIDNTGFYNSHGYFTVAEIILGENNPTWHGKPVVVSVMVREPRANCDDDFEFVDEKSAWERV
ncbi:hypothetical protein BDZ94DRAFT_1263159 [Collybia nuda]|uniref:N-acetyltransferase domain-containing protein n=1 Tax=Collybia nuda TaxID=64659 RepID=A0A9P5Y3R1_9AGAR|nr:hypothetical protein BDZ94DRAFT_1263159 [Collybia nuda]